MTFVRRAAWGLLAVSLCRAQAPQPLNLQQALAIAVKNHPQVQVALLNALAANQLTLEQKAAYYPNAFMSVTGAGALTGSRIAAGSLNNPIIYDRTAGGLTITQMLTDFGRTSNLTAAARYHTEAVQQTANATRAEIMLAVARAYFNALRAQSVLTVAQQTVAERQLVSDQVTALAKSKLKSGLDVSFANVNLAEAKLLQVSAENELDAAFAELNQAMGGQGIGRYQLAEESMPPAMPPDPGPLVSSALQNRPELASFRAQHESDLRYVKAQRALSYPTISALASGGGLPVHQDTLTSRWAAVGVNVNIPIFNGYLFSAERQQAEYQAAATEQQMRNEQIGIARDVNVAFLNARTAFERLGLTQQLLNEANLALDLANQRYKLGLSSIVELSQAQLNQTSAQIASASARYEYQLQRAVLDYQTGNLK